MSPAAPDFDDDLTPALPGPPAMADVPMEIVRMQQTLKQQAKAIREIRSERKEAQKSLKGIKLALIGVAVTILLTASAALLQMGAYMERIDHVAESQRRVEQRIDSLR